MDRSGGFGVAGVMIKEGKRLAFPSSVPLSCTLFDTGGAFLKKGTIVASLFVFPVSHKVVFG